MKNSYIIFSFQGGLDIEAAGKLLAAQEAEEQKRKAAGVVKGEGEHWVGANKRWNRRSRALTTDMAYVPPSLRQTLVYILPL